MNLLDRYFSAHAEPELRRTFGVAVRARHRVGDQYGPWIDVADALVEPVDPENISEEVARRHAWIISVPVSTCPEPPAQIELTTAEGGTRELRAKHVPLDAIDATAPTSWRLYCA